MVSDYNARYAATHPVMFFFGDGLATEEFVDNVGAGNFDFPHEGLVPSTRGEEVQYRAFEERFVATHGFAPYPYLTCAYDAAMLILLAIAASDAADGASIRDALPAVSSGGSNGEMVVGPSNVAAAVRAAASLQEIDYQGASGEVDFDARGDVDGTYNLWEVDAIAGRVDVETGVSPAP